MKSTICLTGTHLTPALAFLETLQLKNYQVIYLGRTTQTETKLLNQMNIKQFKIASPKLNRFQVISSLKDSFKFPIGITQAAYYLNKYQVKAVVSFGGYVAVPVCFAAKLLNLPIIIHEQTFKSGLASNLTSKLAQKIAISWPESKTDFNPSKTVLTGNPLRSGILSLKRSKSKSPTLYITGGNQGSKVINEVTNQALLNLLKAYKVYHQFGLNQTKKDWQKQLDLVDSLPLSLKNQYILKKWFDLKSLQTILASTDLVISRSGANTITELAYLKIPAVLIPIPITQKNEQLVNAKYLESLGLALILPQKNLDQKTLLSTIKKAQKNLPKKTQTTFNFSLVKSASSNLFKLLENTLNEKKTQKILA